MYGSESYETELRKAPNERLRFTQVELLFVIATVQTFGDMLLLTTIHTVIQAHDVGI